MPNGISPRGISSSRPVSLCRRGFVRGLKLIKHVELIGVDHVIEQLDWRKLQFTNRYACSFAGGRTGSRFGTTTARPQCRSAEMSRTAKSCRPAP